jgi:hypothetical protein
VDERRNFAAQMAWILAIVVLILLFLLFASAEAGYTGKIPHTST